tara:strand:+ start:224 stop:469 length:246 start_codon:yes stop_codon:yes gene_type:complete
MDMDIAFDALADIEECYEEFNRSKSIGDSEGARSAVRKLQYLRVKHSYPKEEERRDRKEDTYKTDPPFFIDASGSVVKEYR